MKFIKPATMMFICAASMAIAHDGVANEAVKARMDVMKTIGASTGTMGKMLQGKAEFDADAAAAAATAMANAAAQIPTVFEANETDPESEASPEIWTNWDDFVAKGAALEMGAKALDTSSLDALKASFGGAAGTCKACHSKYRIQK
ncbi:MAG: cytochrome c [Pseudoruegeria sp.]